MTPERQLIMTRFLTTAIGLGITVDEILHLPEEVVFFLLRNKVAQREHARSERSN